jgi:hypothetical protein
MYLILLAYMAVAAFCLAFVDTLGPVKDVIVVAAFIATAVGIWRSEPDGREMKQG